MNLSRKIAGAFLVLGGGLLTFVILAFFVHALPNPNGLHLPSADWSVQVRNPKLDGLNLVPSLDALAVGCLAIGALSLLDSPGRVGWILVATGGFVLFPIYAAEIGGYGVVFEVNDPTLSLISLARFFSATSFFSGHFCLSIGLAFVFWTEFRAARNRLPRWFYAFVIGLNILSFVALLTVHFDYQDSLLLSGIAKSGCFICVLIYGVALIHGGTFPGRFN